MLTAETHAELVSAAEPDDFLCEVRARVEAGRSVRHPFLDWYRANGLSREQEFVLFSECYTWFRDLPFYVSGLAGLTRDTRVLREVMLNVMDEVGGEQTHADLYREFLVRLGLDLQSVQAYAPSDAALALNTGMQRLYSTPPFEKALGALYYDEAMSAVMVGRVNDALAAQGYDLATRHFWDLHVNLELGHSDGMRRAALPYVTDPAARALFLEGVRELETLVEAFWDNVSLRLGVLDAAAVRNVA